MLPGSSSAVGVPPVPILVGSANAGLLRDRHGLEGHRPACAARGHRVSVDEQRVAEARGPCRYCRSRRQRRPSRRTVRRRVRPRPRRSSRPPRRCGAAWRPRPRDAGYHGVSPVSKFVVSIGNDIVLPAAGSQRLSIHKRVGTSRIHLSDGSGRMAVVGWQWLHDGSYSPAAGPRRATAS